MRRRSDRRDPSSPVVAVLLDNLDRAYRGRSWHGTSLRGTLRGLTVDVARWRCSGFRESLG